MTKRNLLFTVSALALVGLVTGGMSVSAHQGWFGGKGFDPEKREAVTEALENQDFEAWQEAMGEHKIGEVITEDNFGQFVQMHQALQDGDLEQAKQIREELGWLGFGHGGRFSSEDLQAMKEAIESGDYNAWKELVGDNEIAEIITEDNFDEFVRMHQLMREGNFEEARQIREELGLPDRGFAQGFRHGFEMGYRHAHRACDADNDADDQSEE